MAENLPSETPTGLGNTLMRWNGTSKETHGIIKNAVDDAMLMLKYAAQQGYNLETQGIDIDILIAVSHALDHDNLHVARI